jgi:hypothetical protein
MGLEQVGRAVEDKVVLKDDEEIAMAEPAKPQPATPAAPAPEYHWTYGLLFQAWLALFLLVVCFALVNYLFTFVPK